MFVTKLSTLFVIFMFQGIETNAQECNGKPVKESVYINKKINTDDEAVYVFETKQGLSADQCIEECKLRKRCSFVNHHKYAQLCYMIANDTNDIQLNISDSNGFIYGNKSQWNMKLHEKECKNCKKAHTCQLPVAKNQKPICTFTGCGPPPSIPCTIILGNVFRVGSKLKYKCQDNLQMTKYSHSQIICQENGTWTESKIQCVGCCGRPPSIDNTTIIGKNFTVGSKLKYKCQDKLQMTTDSHSQITCQENGNWTESKIQCVGCCGPPLRIPYTTAFGNVFRVGSKLNYKCQDKLQMTRDSKSEIMCQENGNWTKWKMKCVVDPCKANKTWDTGNSSYFIEQNDKLWYESKSNCEINHADLVHIGCEDEKEFLKIFLQECAGKNTETVYMHIGRGDKSSMNGKTQNCVAIDVDNKWTYDVCHSDRAYWSFCEQELKNNRD